MPWSAVEGFIQSLMHSTSDKDRFVKLRVRNIGLKGKVEFSQSLENFISH
jgi:hypothetical protein